MQFSAQNALFNVENARCGSENAPKGFPEKMRLWIWKIYVIVIFVFPWSPVCIVGVMCLFVRMFGIIASSYFVCFYVMSLFL